MAHLFVLLTVVLFSVYQTEQAYFLEESFIDAINSQATTWKAGVNFNPSTPKEYIISLLGSKGVRSAKKSIADTLKTRDVALDFFPVRIPEYFDARKNWRQCRTIGEVRDQGHCGSSWAFSTTSAFADRLCIATHGKFNEQLSAEELTFCCRLCGNGCHGGDPFMAWYTFFIDGIVTGGCYGSEEGCEPYRVKPCLRDQYGNNTCEGKPMEENHVCRRMCYGDRDLDFKEDHRHTRDAYHLSYSSIQRDVLMHGPVETSFDVYDDFPSYKSGVYIKSKNAKKLGSLSVKLIGWGYESNVPYWLAVNSWGENWGDKGFFKIRRSTNECGIDNSATAGVPAVFF